jgi:ribosomal-protein-alanine N-acetyltransferase
MIAFGLGRFYLPRGRLIEGDRVYLRPPQYGDWRAWAALREQSRIFLTPWEPTWPGDALSRASFRRRQHHVILEWREDSGYSLFVFRREDDRLLGGVTLSNVRRGIAQAASLGYWTGAPFARQGYMSAALQALLPFAFERLGLHRIEAACLPHNAASRQLLIRTGFQEEGLARRYLRINGTWQDHALYALLRDDPWQKG